MHAAIRSYRTADVESFAQKVEDEFIERVKSVDGFIGYCLIDGEDGTATTITVAETARAVEASTEQADRWVIERAAHLVESAPAVTSGKLRIRAER